MNYKNTLMLLSAVLGVTCTVTGYAKEQTGHGALQSETAPEGTQELAQFRTAVETVAELNEDASFSKLKDSATYAEIQAAYQIEQVIILKDMSKDFTVEQQQLFTNLEKSLSRADRIFKDDETIHALQNKIENLFTDGSQTTFKEEVTEETLLAIYQEFSAFNMHTHDTSSTEKVDRLNQLVSHAVTLWVSRTQTNVQQLFSDHTYTKLASGVTKETIQKVSTDVNGLVHLDVDATQLSTLQQMVNTAFSLVGTVAETTDISLETTVHPGEPGWYGVVTSAVAFTDANKDTDLDASVKIVNADDQANAYTGTKSIAVKVQSTNGFDLKDGSKEAVAYSITTKAGTAIQKNTTEQDLGMVTGEAVAGDGNNVIASRAALKGPAKESGKYMDTLNYHFIEQ